MADQFADTDFGKGGHGGFLVGPWGHPHRTPEPPSGFGRTFGLVNGGPPLLALRPRSWRRSGNSVGSEQAEIERAGINQPRFPTRGHDVADRRHRRGKPLSRIGRSGASRNRTRAGARARPSRAFRVDDARQPGVGLGLRRAKRRIRAVSASRGCNSGGSAGIECPRHRTVRQGWWCGPARRRRKRRAADDPGALGTRDRVVLPRAWCLTRMAAPSAG